MRCACSLKLHAETALLDTESKPWHAEPPPEIQYPAADPLWGLDAFAIDLALWIQSPPAESRRGLDT